MKKNQHLYVSFDYDEYKEDKANLLYSQIGLLNAIKHLKNLNGIKAEKNNLKFRLYQLFSSILDSLEKLKGNLPKPKIPQTIKSPEGMGMTFTIQAEGYKVKGKNIDKELYEIQEKLARLNQ